MTNDPFNDPDNLGPVSAKQQKEMDDFDKFYGENRNKEADYSEMQATKAKLHNAEGSDAAIIARKRDKMGAEEFELQKLSLIRSITAELKGYHKTAFKRVPWKQLGQRYGSRIRSLTGLAFSDYMLILVNEGYFYMHRTIVHNRIVIFAAEEVVEMDLLNPKNSMLIDILTNYDM